MTARDRSGATSVLERRTASRLDLGRVDDPPPAVVPSFPASVRRHRDVTLGEIINRVPLPPEIRIAGTRRAGRRLVGTARCESALRAGPQTPEVAVPARGTRLTSRRLCPPFSRASSRPTFYSRTAASIFLLQCAGHGSAVHSRHDRSLDQSTGDERQGRGRAAG